MCSENVNFTLKQLEEVGKVLDWFSNNFLKANTDKCHLILSTDEPFSINIDNEVIKNSNNKKLGIWELTWTIDSVLKLVSQIFATEWARNCIL